MANYAMSTRLFASMMNKIFIRAPKPMRNVATVGHLDFGFANHLVLITCFCFLGEVGQGSTPAHSL
jgi:hypothetical protein